MKEYDWNESVVLPILSLLLVVVFCFSVSMFDTLCVVGESGVLAVFASDVRTAFGEDTVWEEEVTDIDATAEAYIARYNAIYRDLQ